MLILALGIVAASVIWLLFVKREKPVGPVVRWVGGSAGIVVLGLVATLRGGLVAGVLVVAAGSFLLWVSMGGLGGGGGGGGGPDPPREPDPDPSPGERADLPPKALDHDAFDRARAEWERAVPRAAEPSARCRRGASRRAARAAQPEDAPAECG